MKLKPISFALAIFVIASCNKSGEKTNSDDTSSKRPEAESRVGPGTRADESTAGSSDAADTTNTIDLPISHPVDASMIKPAGTAPEDASWETLTAEQRLVKFNSMGIASVPKNVSEKILGKLSGADSPEDQVRFITQQAASWHHVNEFKEAINDIPDHMKQTLIGRLSEKHGDSWSDMATELDEQVAASVRVMELRLNGISGMSPDESQDLIINALEKYGPDYKTILSIADQNAK